MAQFTREYVFGHTTQEYERLRRQAQVWETDTAMLLDRATLSPGDRCLDVGCGPGETMRLMADRVGPTGRVLGIDVDANLGRDAVNRLHTAGHRQCDFVPANVEDDTSTAALPVGTGFDLVYARALLVHLADPVAGLRRLWRWTAPGGTLIVQDYDIRTIDVHPPLPVIPEWREVLGGLVRPHFGHQLPTRFAEAGIGEPDGTHVAGRVDRFDGLFSEWLTACYRSALPIALERGLTTQERSTAWFANLDTALTTAGHHTALWPLLIGVHKRKQ